MIVQDIYLKQWDWVIRVYYAINEHFISNILIDLLEINCDGDAFFEIKELMESGENNVGFTYTNPSKKQSIILIGVTDSSDEFQSTFDHEKGHLAMHIAEALGIPPFSEQFQYLSGKIGKEMFTVAKKFLCDHCRKFTLESGRED